MSQRLVIIDGVRTPFGKAGGALSALSADDLGRRAVAALLTRSGLDPAAVDEVIFGCVHQPVEVPNIARVIALRAGLPPQVPAATVQRNCASGLEALTTAYERLQAGRGSLFVVGGVESMSQVPLLYEQGAAQKFAAVARAKSLPARVGAMVQFRAEDFTPRLGLKLGLMDYSSGLSMGETAEILAREQGITRDAQDEFSLRSHERAVAARERMAEEIAPIYTPVQDGSGSLLVEADQGPRTEQSLAILRELRPAFDRFGSVTAGNSSQITDGAVALLVGTEARAEQLGLTPLGYLRDYAYTGCDPVRMGLGPLSALEALEARTGLTTKDADLVEINEAFAAQVLAVLKLLRERDREISSSRLNVNGGAIALGHPVGATGARLVLSSLLELRRRDQSAALVSLCVGGGQGAALWLERSR